MAAKQEGVQVFIRIRPTAQFAEDLLEIGPDDKTIIAGLRQEGEKEFINNKVTKWSFGFSGILHNASQHEVYQLCATKLVSRSLEGYNSTLFAYGQTGSGKTYTITGSTKDYVQRGIIPRAIAQLFQEIQTKAEKSIEVQVSYLEIYREQVFDLLNSYSGFYAQTTSGILITEDADGNAYAKGLSYHPVKNEEEALSLLFEGEANRLRGYHHLNRNSSRSHCIFTLYIESRSTTDTNPNYTVSKLNIVDLAGSERLSKTGPLGKNCSEATSINKSLTFLEQAVISLAQKKRDHIPYRQSKLTHILKDAIGGSCFTVMIGNVWGEAEQMEETLSTLRFGNRVRSIINEPAIQYLVDSKRQCKQLEKEVNFLKLELAMYNTITNRKQVQYEALSQAQIERMRVQIQRFIDGEIQEIEILNVRQVKEVFEQFKQMMKAMKAALEARQNEQQLTQVSGEKREITTKGKGVRVKSGMIITQDDVPLVGETDGQGFGVGSTPPSVRPAPVGPVVTARKTKSRRGKVEQGNNADGRETSQQAFSPGYTGEGKVTAGQEGTNAMSASNGMTMIQPGKEVVLGASIPNREEGFELFKKERGGELQRVLNQNKGVLISKKKDVKRLVAAINEVKAEIDATKKELEDIRLITSQEGKRITTNLQPVIEEEEFNLIKKEKTLKETYRGLYEDLENEKGNVQYCERFVDQCRKRLVQEFEAWYAESFSSLVESAYSKTGDGKVPNESDLRSCSQESCHDIDKTFFDDLHEDQEEKFQRQQMNILMKDPESVPFHNARMSSERRSVLRASMGRRPGFVTTQVRNKPPSTLTVS